MTKTNNKKVVICPGCESPYNFLIPDKLPQYPRQYCKECKKQFSVISQIKTSQTSHEKTIKPSSSGSPILHSSDIISDDPDELLYSVAIRELNKKNPDPRWANILINCIKENITSKNEVLERFKQFPTQTLVNILSKNLQEEP